MRGTSDTKSSRLAAFRRRGPSRKTSSRFAPHPSRSTSASSSKGKGKRREASRSLSPVPASSSSSSRTHGIVAQSVRNAIESSTFSQSSLVKSLMSSARKETNEGFTAGRKKRIVTPLAPPTDSSDDSDVDMSMALRPKRALPQSKPGNMLSVSLVAILPNGLNEEGSLRPPRRLVHQKLTSLVAQLVNRGLAVSAGDDELSLRFDRTWGKKETIHWLRALLPDFFKDHLDAHPRLALHVLCKQGHGNFSVADGDCCGSVLAINKGCKGAGVKESKIFLTTTEAVPRHLWAEEGQEDEEEGEEWSGIAHSDEDGSDSGESLPDSKGSPLRRSQRVASMPGEKKRKYEEISETDDSDLENVAPASVLDQAASQPPLRPVKRARQSSTGGGGPSQVPFGWPSSSYFNAHAEQLVDAAGSDVLVARPPAPGLFIRPSSHLISYQNIWSPNYQPAF